jgi:hypothetical protein
MQKLVVIAIQIASQTTMYLGLYVRFPFATSSSRSVTSSSHFPLQKLPTMRLHSVRTMGPVTQETLAISNTKTGYGLWHYSRRHGASHHFCKYFSRSQNWYLTGIRGPAREQYWETTDLVHNLSPSSPYSLLKQTLLLLQAFQNTIICSLSWERRAHKGTFRECHQHTIEKLHATR